MKSNKQLILDCTKMVAFRIIYKLSMYASYMYYENVYHRMF